MMIQYVYVICLVAYETVAWYTGIYVAVMILPKPAKSTSFLKIVSCLIVSSFGYIYAQKETNNTHKKEIHTHIHDNLDDKFENSLFADWKPAAGR